MARGIRANVRSGRPAEAAPVPHDKNHPSAAGACGPGEQGLLQGGDALSSQTTFQSAAPMAPRPTLGLWTLPPLAMRTGGGLLAAAAELERAAGKDPDTEPDDPAAVWEALVKLRNVLSVSLKVIASHAARGADTAQPAKED